VRVVGDQESAIVDALNTLRHRCTYVFTTGGIGPTHGDITADCVAKAFGVPIDVIRRTGPTRMWCCGCTDARAGQTRRR
jgi:molybdopterin-biosynthesis enzyme MoeA-like protein